MEVGVVDADEFELLSVVRKDQNRTVVWRSGVQRLFVVVVVDLSQEATRFTVARSVIAPLSFHNSSLTEV